MYALEARHAPVVSLWVWYHVGGRNEVPGTTGMSHFLEHMLFKGTPTHPKGDLDRLLARYGAHWNAFTSEDVTCYYDTVPRGRFGQALELEADRMRNADRKSTRLNSSHLVISYAVFCLKKKKKHANDCLTHRNKLKSRHDKQSYDVCVMRHLDNRVQLSRFQLIVLKM